MRLSEIQPGECAIVTGMEPFAKMRRRIQDLGIIPGTRIACVRKSPLGDPCAYLVRRTVIALRKADARQIWIAEVKPWKNS